MQEKQEKQGPSLGGEDPLEEEMATHSSILAWEIPWTEELGRLQSTDPKGIRHDLATKQQQWGYAVIHSVFSLFEDSWKDSQKAKCKLKNIQLIPAMKIQWF